MTRLLILIGLAFVLTGCTEYSCKDNVALGMTIPQAYDEILHLRMIAEEQHRQEFSCKLVINCYDDKMFQHTEPYKLTFLNGELVRIEIDQDEKTRQEIESSIHERSSVHGRFFW